MASLKHRLRSGRVLCECTLPQAPPDYRAICTSQADYLAWPNADFCNDDCPGHPLCAACAALSVQRKECRELEFHGKVDHV